MSRSVFHTCHISLGRNVGDVPMSDEDWLGYKLAVQASIGSVGGQIIQRPHKGEQLGLWEGCEEDACVFVAFVLGKHINQLKRCLVEDATKYKQLCIGFIERRGTHHLLWTV